jgi:hypothetical protein
VRLNLTIGKLEYPIDSHVLWTDFF